jgi:hypothetical protein
MGLTDDGEPQVVIHCPQCGLTVNAPADEPVPTGGPICAMGHEPVQMVRVYLGDVNRG